MTCVPARWNRKSPMMIATTSGTVGRVGKRRLSPSTAEEIEMAGVRNPSEIRVAHPMSAGKMIQRPPGLRSSA